MSATPHHQHHHGHTTAGHSTAGQPALNRLAFQATLHCMTGCAIGEVAGMVIGTAIGLSMWETVGLAVTLAFITGFGLTMIPLVRSGMRLRQALGIAFAADFISVTVMEIVDNAVMMAIPGAMAAGPLDWFFWLSMALALAIAFAVALPVNLWLIRRGKGHAVVHSHH
jgi:hypothetical protein